MKRKGFYRKQLVRVLLEKFYERKESSNKRPSVTPKNIYPEYESNSCELAEKNALNEAAFELMDDGYVNIKNESFGMNIEKIFLCMDSVGNLESLARDCGISVRGDVVSALDSLHESLLEDFQLNQNIETYIEDLRAKAYKKPKAIDLEKERGVLEVAAFISNNNTILYEREASMLSGKDSKFVESNRKRILTCLNSQSLEDFHVYKVETEFRIKGNVTIHFYNGDVDVAMFSEGISLTIADISNIEKIHVKDKHLMTIENKTAFHRFAPKDTATVFLSGFANHEQIEFLKLILSWNPELKMFHFGDIDVGGFLILDNLEKSIKRDVIPFCMGVEQLSDPKHTKPLLELSEEDSRRIGSVSEKHKDVVEYMKKNNVKLEQEIIAYRLAKGLSYNTC